MWVYFIIVYLISAVVYTQFYKVTTKSSDSKGALTVVLEFFSGLVALLFMPFFKFTFPTDYKIYIYLGIALIFYAISDRLNTTIRKGIEASTYSMIKQLTTVFMILGGLLFLKEPLVLKKIIGSVLIIFSNFLVFYDKDKTKGNKYIILAIISNIISATSLFVGVNISGQFNIAFYAALTVIVPAILIMIFERIKFKDLKKEIVEGNRKALIFTCIGWGIMLVAHLLAYNYGKVTQVAPLTALTVMLNVIVGYIFLKERKNIWKKLIAAVLIIISIILIKG